MAIARVQSTWTGTSVRGGGLTQMFFGEGGTGDAQDAADAVHTFWTSIAAQWSYGNTVAIDPIVTNFDEVTGDLIGLNTVTPGPAVTGSSGGDPLPPATQGLLRWITGGQANNRIIRGRTFLPAWAEANNGGSGQPAAGAIAAVNEAGQTLIDDPTADLVVWHRPVLGHNGSAPSVLTCSMWTEFAVLRSRRD